MTGNAKYITIKIRMFSGAIEQDFIFKFFDGPLYGEDVLKAVANRLGLSARYQQLFGLWIISKDLGIYFIIYIKL